MARLVRDRCKGCDEVEERREQARMFECGACRRQVFICSYCDRGQIYCGDHCSVERREASLAAAGKRYRSTLKAKMAAARRQAVRRERLCDQARASLTGRPDASSEVQESEPDAMRLPGVTRTVVTHQSRTNRPPDEPVSLPQVRTLVVSTTPSEDPSPGRWQEDREIQAPSHASQAMR